MLYKILKFLFKKTVVRIYEKGYKQGYDEGMDDLVDKVVKNRVVETKSKVGMVNPQRRTGRRQF